MKKIRVIVSYELEIPNHWDVLSPFDEERHPNRESCWYDFGR